MHIYLPKCMYLFTFCCFINAVSTIKITFNYIINRVTMPISLILKIWTRIIDAQALQAVTGNNIGSTTIPSIKLAAWNIGNIITKSIFNQLRIQTNRLKNNFEKNGTKVIFRLFTSGVVK